MNISSHTFVPTRKTVFSSGTKAVFYDYYFNGVGKLIPFPYSPPYTYVMNPNIWTPISNQTSIDMLPYQVNDPSIPKVFILLSY